MPKPKRSRWDRLRRLKPGDAIILENVTQRSVSSGVSRLNKRAPEKFRVESFATGVMIMRTI